MQALLDQSRLARVPLHKGKKERGARTLLAKSIRRMVRELLVLGKVMLDEIREEETGEIDPISMLVLVSASKMDRSMGRFFPFSCKTEETK